jgi:hypothetical protein
LTALFSFSALCGGQSLSEIAKKEKERREKNKEKGEEVRVITEEELQQATASTYSTTGVASRTSPASGPRGRSQIDEDDIDDADTSTEIPPDADLRDKIALFEEMVKDYNREVQEIDEEIAKNNARLEQIEQELINIGGSGLPTAPVANRAPLYEGNTVPLRAEQQRLRDRNQELEDQKRQAANELRQKGRRAGIPAGYLRF